MMLAALLPASVLAASDFEKSYVPNGISTPRAAYLVYEKNDTNSDSITMWYNPSEELRALEGAYELYQSSGQGMEEYFGVYEYGTDLEKNLFSPDANISREQCATMLTRAFKAYTFSGWTLATDADFASQFKSLFTEPSLFADDAQISDYAKDSVYFMVANGIINGVGDNLFAPRHGTMADEAATYGLATREQALKIGVGMVTNLK